MNKIIFSFAIGILFLTTPVCAKEEQHQVFLSSDGTLSANVISVQNSENSTPESQVRISQTGGAVLCQKDYSSADGKHGATVIQTGWTDDSQFFVFSTRSSGGFQVWESPVFFYSRQDNNLHALDDYLTPCATSVFILKAPDIITLTIWTPFRMRTIGSIRLPITFKLSDLLKEKRRDGPI